MSKDILIAEISGKRPGTFKQRPTERFITKHDKVIISNNSEGYTTDWQIIDVPEDYKKWYVDNIKSSDNAWYAPMNRSYAIKYAREHGYKYLVQLDGNIDKLEIAYFDEKSDIKKRLRYQTNSSTTLIDDFIEMFKAVLDNTNACMVGCSLNGIAEPDMLFLSERYCYSIFALKLDVCPDVFQGDFEDDVEYRLKCAQKGYPVVQISPLKYGKVGQAKNKDLSGCRAEYAKQGVKRGEHMSLLYGDKYSCKMSKYRHFTAAKPDDEAVNFKHTLKPFKVGVIVYNQEPINNLMKSLFQKYAAHKEDKCIIKERRRKIK